MWLVCHSSLQSSAAANVVKILWNFTHCKLVIIFYPRPDRPKLSLAQGIVLDYRQLQTGRDRLIRFRERAREVAQKTAFWLFSSIWSDNLFYRNFESWVFFSKWSTGICSMMSWCRICSFFKNSMGSYLANQLLNYRPKKFQIFLLRFLLQHRLSGSIRPSQCKEDMWRPMLLRNCFAVRSVTVPRI